MAEDTEQTQQSQQKPTFNLDEDEKDRILEELFQNGYATWEVDLLPGKLTAVVSNLRVQDQLQIEQEMTNFRSSQMHLIHSYSLKLLGATVRKYGSKDFSDSSREEVEKFLENQSSLVLDKLTKAQNKFENTIGKILNVEEINNSFMMEPGAAGGSGLNLKDTNQENEEA